MSTINERLKLYRAEKELSYDELSEKTGIPKSTLRRYELGQTKKIPLGNISAVAKALGIKPSVLMGWEEEPQAKQEEYKKRVEAIEMYEQTDKKMAELVTELGFTAKLVSSITDVDESIINGWFEGRYALAPNDMVKIIEAIKILKTLERKSYIDEYSTELSDLVERYENANLKDKNLVRTILDLEPLDESVIKKK